MSKVTISQRLYLGFGIIIGLSIIVFVINGVLSLNSRKKAMFTKDESVVFGGYAKDMKLDIVQVQQWLTDISATQGKDGLNDGFDKAAVFADDFQDLLNKFKAKYEKDNYADGLRNIEQLKKDFEEYYENGKKMANAYIKGGSPEGNPLMKDFDTYSVKIQSHANNFYDDVMSDVNRSMNVVVSSSQKLVNFNFITAVLMLILGIVITITVGSSIVKFLSKVINNLLDSSDQTQAAAGHVSSASQQLSQGATEQAASLEQTSSSLDEMSSMTKQNADNAAKANQLARDARGFAEQGNEAMDQMLLAMGEINTSSDKISKIIKNIEEIAFQTNLLALNAAVEAARAGEHGKGFAVVAEEVRNLARRSADSSKETASLIEDSMDKVKTGTDIAKKAGQSLKEITDSSRKVADIVAEIAAASKEQAEGIIQVSNAISQIDHVTQQNASVAEESASASEELASQTGVLKEMVNDLQQIVGGSIGSRLTVPQAKVIGVQRRQGEAGKNIKISPPVHEKKEKGADVAMKKAVKLQGLKVIKPEEIIPLDDDKALKDF